MTPIKILSTICVTIALVTAILAQGARKIAGIETEGLQALTTETVIATSGLKVGDTFTSEATDAAAERLLSSGLFKKVGYRTRTVGNNITITFQLEEVKGQSSPVVFDNFIWFTDEELAAAIKREVPAFNGTAPDIGNTNEAIKKALQNLLTEHKLPGQVEYNLTEREHLFRIEGAPMKICTLHFPGAKGVSEQKLIETTRSSMDQEYSRQSAATFPKAIIYLTNQVAHETIPSSWRAKTIQKRFNKQSFASRILITAASILSTADGRMALRVRLVAGMT